MKPSRRQLIRGIVAGCLGGLAFCRILRERKPTELTDSQPKLHPNPDASSHSFDGDEMTHHRSYTYGPDPYDDGRFDRHVFIYDGTGRLIFDATSRATAAL